MALCLVLACCRSENNVTLYRGEKWKAEFIVTVSADELELAGGRERTEEQFEAELASSMSALEASGVEYSWSSEQLENGGQQYTVTMSGVGWDLLDLAVFDGQATIEVDDRSGSRQIRLRSSTTSLDAYLSSTWRVTGGSIIDSNADYVDGDTAVWYDPYYIEAVLTEKPRTSVGLVVGGVTCGAVALLVALAAVVVGIVALSRRSAKPVFCMKCGTQNKSGGKFCTKCGASLKE